MAREGKSEQMFQTWLTGNGVKFVDQEAEKAYREREEDASLLQIPPGAPVFRLEQYLYAHNETVAGWGFFIFRGDRFPLISEVRPLKEVE